MATVKAIDGGTPRSGRRRIVRGNQAGTTLIEILFSVVVLSLIIVPVFDSLVSGRMLAAHRGEERMALKLVERKAEQLMQAGFGSVGSDADVSSTSLAVGTHPTDPSIVLNTRGDADSGNDVLGRLTWNVRAVSWSSSGDSVHVKEVDVKMAWPAAAPQDSTQMTILIGS
jgi:Tfp pilus assembly protein PilX